MALVVVVAGVVEVTLEVVVAVALRGSGSRGGKGNVSGLGSGCTHFLKDPATHCVSCLQKDTT